MKFVYFILILSLLFVRNAVPAWANPFNQSYTITYTFDERGNAQVSKNVSLTNLDENLYPSEYSLDIPEDAINIAAFDEIGKLEVQVGHKDDKKLAKLLLNSQNIGIRNNTELALSYETRQLVQGEGDARLIAIPPLISTESVGSATVIVKLPDSWGEPDIIEPVPETPRTWRDKELEEGIRIQYIPDSPTITPQVRSATNAPAHIAGSYTPFLGLIVGLCVVGLGFILSKLLHRP